MVPWSRFKGGFPRHGAPEDGTAESARLGRDEASEILV
jgi:hypothetical protein